MRMTSRRIPRLSRLRPSDSIRHRRGGRPLVQVRLEVYSGAPNRRLSALSCCRFRGHRDWVFHEAGGGRCRDGSSVESSRSRRFGWLVTAGVGGPGGPGPRCPRERAAQMGEGVLLRIRQAFPGHGQVKPEQLEIDRLRREVTKLKAERDILKKAAAFFARKRHEVRLHREAPRHLAGGMAMRSAGRLAIRLPCLAHPVPSTRALIDEALASEDQGELSSSARTYGARRVWRDVLAEGFSCGLHRIERLMRSEALRARPRRRRRLQRRRSEIGRCRAERARSPVHCRASEPEVDRRLHLHLDGRRLALRCGRDRPVLAPRCRLVDEGGDDRATRDGCAHHGGLAPWQARCPAAPLGSGQPVYERAVPAPDGGHGIDCSMSRSGNVWDNAAMESFFSS